MQVTDSRPSRSIRGDRRQRLHLEFVVEPGPIEPVVIVETSAHADTPAAPEAPAETSAEPADEKPKPDGSP